MMAYDYKSRMEPPLRIPSPEDVLAAFPAPPNHIPASPAASVATSSSYFSLPRTKTAPKRQDSAASAWSSGSGQSARSGKLSVLVNGKDVEFERQSDSGSSSSSGLNVSAAGSMLPSPMSGRAYFTAPNSPLPPAAGSSSSLGDVRSSPLSLNSPTSAYPTSTTSSASAYPASSAPSSAYPHSPAYSYSNTNRFAYPSPYTPSSSSSPASAYVPSSARTALSMLSTPVSASASSSPSSVQVPISAVGSSMSPIEERDERERERPRTRTRTQRQSSVPPPNFRRQPPIRRESGSEIGGPPCAPLPPLPSTAKSNSSFGESTPKPTQTQMPSQDSTATATATPRGPASVKSLPSLRSNRSRKGSSSTQGHEHGRKESGVSVLSAGSGVSAAAPSLAEFGVATRNKVETQVESGSEPGNDRISEWERPRSRARTPRAGTLPLRIDIPPSYAQEKDRVSRQQQQQQTEKTSLGSANSVISPFPRELAERTLRERAVADGEKVNSPTASLFSVASGMTARSGLSAAQSLRTRVSGMLDGLPHVPTSAVPSASSSPSAAMTKFASTLGGVGGGGEEFEKQKQQRSRSSSLHPPSMSNGMSRGGVGGSSSNGLGDASSLLTAEDLHSDPLLARSISPVMLLENGRDVSKFSSEFPTTPTARSRAPPPSSYAFAGSSSSSSLLQTPTSSSSSLGVGLNGISRTISQSRRKPLPLPPAPRAARSSTTSFSSRSSFEPAGDRSSYSQMDGADDAIRGRARGGRGRGTEVEDGSTSPDIETMMCKTPRPALRSKSLSARSSRSSRSSKSTSTRSSSVRSSVRNSTRPSLPDERERQSALARSSAMSSSSSASPSRTSSQKYKELSARKSAGSDLADAYGGIEEDGDASVDYGVAIARHRGGYDLSPSLLHVDERLEETVDELGALRTGMGTHAVDFYAEEAEAMLGETDKSSPEQVEEEESDSDIDLHTPLPHILVRDGALSPNSKVLAAASSTGSLSVRSSFVGSGRDSVISNSTHASFGSVMTKTGLFKDERNTEGRRRRHRDGKLLREGLGLTTGLGWSDSEDEDAPSPFTDRLSSLAVSRQTSVASVRSSTSKKSQFFTRSTPSSGSTSRTLSTLSTGRPDLPSSRSSRSPTRKNSEPHPLSKSHSTVGLSRPYAVFSQAKVAGDENQSMSPTLTTSSSTSLPFPPTPRDDCDDSDGSLLSGSAGGRLRATSRASSTSTSAKTPTVGSVKASQSTSQLRARAMSSTKSAPLSRLPSTSGSTPRPLRLPALQLQQRAGQQQEDGLKLHPGQPAPRSGALLGYNRNLHDIQRSQYRDAPKSAPMALATLNQMSPPPDSALQSPAVSPALSAQSAPSSSSLSSTAYGASRRAYGSMPVTSALRPPSSYSAARSREPSPQRLTALTPGIGKPRTGTGMVYRQSSLPPPTPVVRQVGRATAI